MAGLSKVVKSSFWLYVANVANGVFGFVFWLAVSNVAGPKVVGVVGAVVGLSSSLLAVLSLGIPLGLIHRLGAVRCDREDAELLWSALYSNS